MIKIGIYPRKSVYRDNSDSISVQIKMCQDYANIIYKGSDLEFIIYDKDEGFSGKNMNRPSFRELMADVEANKLNAVIVYKLDRISRNVQEFALMYEIFRKHDVAFISVKESFDTSTPMGRTVMYILAAFAQLERESTSERVTDNMLALGSSGHWTGGRLPAGMTSIRRISNGKEHSFLMVDNEKIAFVKMIYDLFLNGMTLTKLERYCRDNGIKSSSGKFLSTSQLHQILMNPVYCSNDIDAYYYFKEKNYTVPDKELFDGLHGLIGYGRTAQNNKNVHKNQWIISIGIHEPVISAADWINVQNRFGKNKMFRSNKYEVGILKGIIRCRCGGRIDIRTYVKNGLIFSYYYCSSMARKGKEFCDTGYYKVNDVDSAFIQFFKRTRLDKESIKFRETSQAYVDVNNLKRESDELKKAIDNLTDALMSNTESTAAGYIIKKIEALDRQKEKIDSSISMQEMQDASRKNAEESRDYIYNNICLLLDNFEELSYTEKNELIKSTVTSCTVTDNGVDIIF